MEDGVLMPLLLHLSRSSSGTLLIRYQKHTLLYANLDSVLLKLNKYYEYLANEVVMALK
jgi:hypothetical protein